MYTDPLVACNVLKSYLSHFSKYEKSTYNCFVSPSSGQYSYSTDTILLLKLGFAITCPGGLMENDILLYTYTFN